MSIRAKALCLSTFSSVTGWEVEAGFENIGASISAPPLTQKCLTKGTAKQGLLRAQHEGPRLNNGPKQHIDTNREVEKFAIHLFEGVLMSSLQTQDELNT